ncbi:DUF6756 family protein [Clostridium sp. JNZ J1-5]
MWNIGEQIKQAEVGLKIEIREVPDLQKDELISRVIKKFCRSRNLFPLWDKLSSYGSISDSQSWSLINKFIGDSEAILFFNPHDERRAFQFKNGWDLVPTLSETYNAEFYVVNGDLDYLICFNHHDTLIICGKAYEWFKKEGLLHEVSM